MGAGVSLGAVTIWQSLLCILAFLGLAAVLCGGSSAEASLSLELEPTGPTSGTFDEPTPVTFRVNLTLRGWPQVQDTVVELKGVPSNWSTTLTCLSGRGVFSHSTRVTLPLDTDATAVVSVTVAPDPSAEGDHELELAAYLESNASIRASMALEVLVPRRSEAALALVDVPYNRTLAAPPGGNSTFRVQVFNLGSHRERMLLSVTTYATTWGWDVRIGQGVDGEGWTPPLDPDPSGGLSHTVVVVVSIPEKEMAERSATVRLSAIPEGDPGFVGAIEVVTVACQRVHGFVIVPEGASWVTVKPEEEADVALYIKNLGNERETFSVTSTLGDSAYDPLRSDAERVPHRTTVEAYSLQRITIGVFIGPYTRSGTYRMDVTVSAPSGTSGPLTLSYSIIVPEVRKALISMADPPDSVGPGGRFSLGFFVKNKGNVEATFEAHVGLDPDLEGHWTYEQDPTEATLGPSEEHYIEVTFDVPDTWEVEAGTYPIELLVSAAGYAGERREVLIELEEVRRVDWQLGSVALTSEDMEEARLPKVGLNVVTGRTAEPWERPLLVNTGNCDVLCELSYYCHRGAPAFELEMGAINVPRGGAVDPGFYPVADESAISGHHEVSVEAHYHWGEEHVLRTLSMNVRTYAEEFELWYFKCSGEGVLEDGPGGVVAALDEPLLINLSVENEMPVTTVATTLRVVATAPDGSSRTLLESPMGIGPGELYAATIDWTPVTHGNHTVDVYVTDEGSGEEWRIGTRALSVAQGDVPVEEAPLAPHLALAAMLAALGLATLSRARDRRG